MAEQPAAQAEQGDVSLHDDLATAWDAAIEAETPEEPPADPPKEDPPKGEEEPPDDPPEQGEEEQPETPAGEEEPPENGEEAEEEESEEEAETPEAPEHWSTEDKAAFDKLPEEAKPLYLDARKSLERGYAEKFQEVAEFRKEKTTLDEMFAPWDGQLKQAGLSRTDWIKGAVQAQTALMANPKEAIAHLAGQYKVDLHDLAGVEKPQDQGEEEYLDPHAAKQIKALQQQITEIQSQQQQSSQPPETDQGKAARVRAQVDEFASAKDEWGQPKYPHFEKVKVTMGRVLQSGLADTMEGAYELAVERDPELSKEPAPKPPPDKTRRAARAKPPKRTPGKAKPPQDMSLRDELNMHWDSQLSDD